MTQADIEKMEQAHKSLCVAEQAFKDMGMDIGKLIGLMDQVIEKAHRSSCVQDTWADARRLTDDILTSGIPSRSSAIALAQEARRMLEVLDGNEVLCE